MRRGDCLRIFSLGGGGMKFLGWYKVEKFLQWASFLNQSFMTKLFSELFYARLAKVKQNTYFSNLGLQASCYRHRAENQEPWTHDRGLRVHDRGPRSKEDRAANLGQWMESKPWMRNFHKLNYRYVKVYEFLRVAVGEGWPLTSVPYVSLLLVLTLPGGFFSGCSGFPHSWKTNIFNFQFKLACPLKIIADKCLPVLYISQD